MAYLWLKALHIIAVISWMAALLYLPRLFVYHSDNSTNEQSSDMLKVMERRLVKAIMVPAGVATWIFGLVLAGISGVYIEYWFLLKFVMVLLMTGLHFYLIHCKNCFAQDQNHHSARFFRILNEVPTLLMIAIVLLVILKPI